MAQIKIKGRNEPIEIVDARALQLKKVWLGFGGFQKADGREVVDLGEWAGEFSQIASITVADAGRPTKKEFDQEQSCLEDAMKILAIPVPERAKLVGQFKLEWFMRSNLTEKEPPQDVIEKAQAISLSYYTANPKEIRVERSLFEPLLSERFGSKQVSISQSLASVLGKEAPESLKAPF